MADEVTMLRLLISQKVGYLSETKAYLISILKHLQIRSLYELKYWIGDHHFKEKTVFCCIFINVKLPHSE